MVELLYMPKLLNPPLVHDCDFQYSSSPAGPEQPSREAHQPFIHFSWKQPLSLINDSAHAEWCFWFDPKKGPPLFSFSHEEG